MKSSMTLDIMEICVKTRATIQRVLSMRNLSKKLKRSGNAKKRELSSSKEHKLS